MAEENKEVAGLDIGSLPIEPSVEEKAEEPKEGDKAVEGEPVASEEENKVSYSRFKNVHTRYRDAERRAQELEERIAELEQGNAERFERSEPTLEGKKWETWAKLYGDTPQSKEAFKDWMSEFAPPDEQYIEQLAERAVERREAAETKRVESNERELGSQLEDVEINIGRELTEDEQVAILEIQDENSLKDDNGRILRLYPAEQAWDLYEIQSGAGNTQRTQARNKVAALTRSGTRGETAVTGKQDNKDFDPRWEALDASMNRRK